MAWLKSQEKGAIAIEITDVCVQICEDGFKAQNPNIRHEELAEKLRERIVDSGDVAN